MHRDGKEFRFRGSPPPFRTALMSTAWLVLRNALFTIVVPGSVVVLLPSLVLEQAATQSVRQKCIATERSFASAGARHRFEPR
jgi:hypothetical protein